MEKINFANNNAPYLSADNLNQMQNNIEEAIGEHYSTEETFTGKYWTDGKKIYNKVMYLGSLPNSEEKIYNWAIENIKEVVDFKIFAISNNQMLNLPYINNNINYIEYWITVEYLNTSQVKLIVGTDRSNFNLRVDLYYTKTTD